MNQRCGFFSLFLLIAMFSFAEDTEHLVVKGDTIYSISRSYKVLPEELMKYNNIADPSKLQIGKRLKIPSSSSVNTSKPNTAVAQTWTEYRIVKNDTLYGLARRYEIPLQELLAKNNFSQDHVLKQGEQILVPSKGGNVPNQQLAINPENATANVAAGTKAANAVTGTSATANATAGTKTATNASATAADLTLIRWPVTPKEIDYMKGKLNGVQVVGEKSESVKSLTQGTVVSAGPYRGFGRVAIIQVTGGYLYVYGGCESLSVKKGDKVGPGTELGKLGIDAVSAKPQLFFQVYKSNTPIDPAKAPRA